MKRLNTLAKSRLPFILVVIAVLVLSFGVSIIVSLCHLTKHVEIDADRTAHSFRSQVKSEVEKTTKLLNHIISASTMNTARALSSSLNGSKPSIFSEIESNVAPSLFVTLSTTPHLNQISYIGFEGLFFSYFIDDQNQTFAMYSNASLGFSHTPRISAYWYTQMADRITGKLFGDIIPSFPTKFVANSSWLQQALELKTDSHSVLGTNWNEGRDALVVNTARIHGNLGLVSLGFLVEEVSRYYTDIDLPDGKSCIVVAGDGKFLAGDSMFSIDPAKENGERNFSCDPSGTLSISTRAFLKIEEKNHILGCSQLDLLGVKLVYALAIRKSGFTHFMDRYKTIILVLLVFIVAITIVLISVLLPIIRRDSIRNMYLSAMLMKQMNATEQAERKSMNKTHAFATASHDVRASLAGMIGLIQICYGQVPPNSELNTNLRQLEGCTNDLSGMLTSILDTSKIEAGKMSLEEEEFDVAQLFEDVVDLYHPVGGKKNVDVIWDPCDGSISKFSRVKCDRVKLRQILSNLLSNAVKFTSEGHVVVRAWIQKPTTLKNSILIEQPDQCSNGLMRSLTCLCFKDETDNDHNPEAMEIVERDPKTIELVCEVDDTGKGIPKEKQNEVFENYVQVKETALGQGGTGLGLGIVQSLVRLMHGEIGIIDKDIGEKGSCFRFNIALSACDNVSESRKENHEDLIFGDSPQISPLLPTPSPNKLENSHVVLLIENEERRRVLKKFIESLGIRVFSLMCPNQLPRALKKIDCKRNRSSSSNVSDVIVEVDSLSQNSPLGSMDGGADYLRSLFRKTSHHFRNTTQGLVLLVVDANTGKLSELSKAVEEFRSGLIQSACRVVWLANNLLSQSNIRGKIFDPNDIVQYKPLHGSRLREVVRLLPEFGGSLPEKSDGGSFLHVGNISHINISKSRENKLNQPGTLREIGSPSNAKPLPGRKILVVDDNSVMRKIATYIFERLGGKVELCTNGSEAVELVSNRLADQKKRRESNITLPFDYILMDCEMPVMDGYDATSEIRKIETNYGVHTPIIGLTAHSLDSEEAKRTFKAGMDACLSKPLTDANLIDVIKKIDGK